MKARRHPEGVRWQGLWAGAEARAARAVPRESPRGIRRGSGRPDGEPTTAKEQLEQAFGLARQLAAKAEQLKALEELVYRITLSIRPEGDDCSDPRRREEVLAMIADAREEIREDTARLVALRREVARTVAAIGDQALRDVLELRYLGCLRWRDVAAVLGYSIANVYKLHAEALEAAEEAFRGGGSRAAGGG